MEVEKPSFDVLTALASDLEKLLDEGAVTSEQLVTAYLGQIKKHNHYGMRLHAIISTAPEDDIKRRARELDEERKVKGKRSPLHGLPIVLKDNTCTPSLGMATTCGSYALVGAKARTDAKIVDFLLEAGLLIIGKANLSEWGNFKQRNMTAGWSAVGGQTQSAYVRGGLLPNAPVVTSSGPAGSSSGSAVSVAAGFAPLAIGSESDGSLVSPGMRAGLYGMKATPGTVPLQGLQGNTPLSFSPGGLAKSAHDLAQLMSVLMQQKSLADELTGSWHGLGVGYVNLQKWKAPAFAVEDRDDFWTQVDTTIKAALEQIKGRGARVVMDAPLITAEEIAEGSDFKDFSALGRYETRRNFENFLALFDGSSVKTLEDLIEFNEANAMIELPPEHPGQETIIATAKETMNEETFLRNSKFMREKAASSIRRLLDEHQVDVVMGPSDVRIPSIAAAAGFPVATMPLAYADFNGRPFGLTFLAPAGKEHVMLKVMSAWQATFPDAHKPPPLLRDWDQFVGPLEPAKL